MNDTMEYKGYVGSIEFSEADGVFYGQILGIRSLVSYEGATMRELVKDFHDAVEDYIELCNTEFAENSESKSEKSGENL